MSVKSGHYAKTRNMIMRVGRVRITRTEYSIITEALEHIVTTLESLQEQIDDINNPEAT